MRSVYQAQLLYEIEYHLGSSIYLSANSYKVSADTFLSPTLKPAPYSPQNEPSNKRGRETPRGEKKRTSKNQKPSSTRFVGERCESCRMPYIRRVAIATMMADAFADNDVAAACAERLASSVRRLPYNPSEGR